MQSIVSNDVEISSIFELYSSLFLCILCHRQVSRLRDRDLYTYENISLRSQMINIRFSNISKFFRRYENLQSHNSVGFERKYFFTNHNSRYKERSFSSCFFLWDIERFKELIEIQYFIRTHFTRQRKYGIVLSKEMKKIISMNIYFNQKHVSFESPLIKRCHDISLLTKYIRFFFHWIVEYPIK